MKLNEYPEPSPVSSTWIEMAEQLGVDRAYSRDVVGAVYSFCRRRHGATVLNDNYVSFLITRSAYVAKGDVLTADLIECLNTYRSDEERMLMRALASSSDPSSLYDTYRMKLVSLQKSQIFSCGYALSVDLNRISADPHEDISFFWLSLFKRVAACLADWRQGNQALQGLVVKTGCDHKDYPVEVKDLFINSLRQTELSRELTPVQLIWTK